MKNKYGNSAYTFSSNIISIEKMAASIKEEICRLQRRKQLHFQQQTGNSDSSDMESPSSPSSPSASSAFSHSPSGKEKPLFTFRQVIFFYLYIFQNVYKNSSLSFIIILINNKYLLFIRKIDRNFANFANFILI